MYINKINNTAGTNFNGMYKIPYTENNLQALKDFVLPTYMYISNEPVTLFSGNNPFKRGLTTIIKEIAEKNNSSIDWLKRNAKNHGLEISEEDVLYVISTENDVNKLLEYMTKRIELKKPTLGSRLKTFLGIKESPEYDENLPKHLISLSQALKYDSQETSAFQEFSKSAKEFATPMELFKAMMSER